MSEINDGGPAFPYWDGPNGKCHSGITKREWFAGMALQGLARVGGDVFTDEIAKWSYAYADAMIKAGEGEK